MAFTDSPCVDRILCGTLGAATRVALRSSLVVLQTAYETELAALRAKLVILNIGLVPVQIASDAATLARQALETPLTVLDPLTEPAEACFELGSLVESFSFRFDRIDAITSDVFDKARRLLSIKDLVETGISKLEGYLSIISDALFVLDACS